MPEFNVEIIEDGKYYNILDNNLVPDTEYKQVKNSPKYEKDVIKIWLRKVPNQDRGHLIARMFKKYLLTSSELKKNREKVNNFFGVRNGENIRPQNPLSNRILKNLEGNYFTSKKFKLF